ncbi:MAG TPA: winged helix-turn-helix domain-containing protein, partial [Nitrolancea sp.]|nr:winged helix-turn-helix domain-containing protein [Nitrolancea sp.]
WDYEFFNATNVIDVHIRSLRRKIDEPYTVKRIVTVRGSGYKLVGNSRS